MSDNQKLNARLSVSRWSGGRWNWFLTLGGVDIDAQELCDTREAAITEAEQWADRLGVTITDRSDVQSDEHDSNPPHSGTTQGARDDDDHDG